MNFDKSHCKGINLHKFVSIRAKEDEVLERCVKAGCGKRHVVKLVNGVPHTTKYAQSHMREFLVPQHRLYASEYGRK